MRGEVARFCRFVRARAGDVVAPGKPIVLARAPGRIDVMGGIADYCGAVVLEGTLSEAALVGAQARSDDRVVVISREAPREGLEGRVELHLADLFAGREGKFDGVRAFFHYRPGQRWAAYLAGNISVLAAHCGARFPHGVTLLLASDVPLGAGVSSSAAVEVAAMCALAALYGISLDGLELARLCQIVENRIVGAPCGIMDQVTCALGRRRSLLALKCQPHELLGFHRLPAGVQVVGINSNVKHAVSGSRYKNARVAAFMGLKIITAHRGADPCAGYLANISPREFRQNYYRLLPAKMTGEEFLATYGETDDPVTTVDPQTTYSVRACTAHPIYENQRVVRFIELLEEAGRAGDERPLLKAGKLMYASHWSYGHNCALGARETDLLVRLAREKGREWGIFGAKITGGGSGGTVAILARDDSRANEAIEEIVATYGKQTGIAAQVFRGSSPGALAYGTREIAV